MSTSDLVILGGMVALLLIHCRGEKRLKDAAEAAKAEAAKAPAIPIPETMPWYPRGG